jgi:hypothetical protein
MNTQRLAQLRISPLHVQQGLFASLALMITLIAVQQFNHWHQNQDVTQAKPVYSHTSPIATATALKSQDVALSFQSVDAPVVADEQVSRQQSWVF